MIFNFFPVEILKPEEVCEIESKLDMVKIHFREEKITRARDEDVSGIWEETKSHTKSSHENKKMEEE